MEISNLPEPSLIQISSFKIIPFHSESVLDKYHGEGQLTAIDINNDNILDIVHTTGTSGPHFGISFYINMGGTLELVSNDKLAYLTDNQRVLGSSPRGGASLTATLHKT
jgi:hypothetical protein